MNLLLETSFIESYGLMIALAVILVVMIVMSYIRNKKFRDDANTLIAGLKVGDDVKTYSGLCGKIVDFSEVDGVKTAIIACDKMGYKGVFEIDVNAIYSKTGVLPEQQPEETPVEEVKEAPVVEEKQEVEQQPEKPKAKKSTKKKAE